MNKKPCIVISMALIFGLLAGCGVMNPRQVDSCLGSHLKTCNPNLYFDFNSTALNERSKENLDWVVEKMEKQPNKVVVVSGFADMKGDDNANLEISKRRANVVKDYIVSQGVSEDRVDVHYVGKSQLSSHDADKQSMERRVEVKFLDNNKNGVDRWFNSLFQ